MSADPAFPTMHTWIDAGGNSHAETVVGMTKREWFAGMALASFRDNRTGALIETLASIAFEIADEMILQSEAKQ